MLKLSIKDIRIYWFTFLINFVFWTIIAPASIQNYDIYLLLPIGFGLLITMIPLGNDMKEGKDILYASLPLKRNKIVIARYISSFVLISVAFAWIIIFGLVIENYLPGLGGELLERLSLESIALLVFIITLIISIYLPFVFKFGFSAVITGGLAVTGLVMVGFWMVSKYLISSNSELLGIPVSAVDPVFDAFKSNNLFNYLGKILNYYGKSISLGLILMMIIAAIAISVIISIRIFNRKEL